ncbi:MAG: DUF7305 domain-containing protein [Planctomycetaceae bacterium]
MSSPVMRTATQRQGAIAVWAACCLVVAIAFLAFAVDWGYIVVTESELQNAADAGALSGARALPEGRAAAIASAQRWSSKNTAAGRYVSTVAGEEIENGLWDYDTATFTVLPVDSTESPNAVRVTCRRIAARGDALPLFFAPVIGTDKAELTASAIAAMTRNRCGVVVGLDSVNVKNGHIDSYDSSLGTYEQQSPRANGNVCSNGNIQLGSVGSIEGDATPGPGHTVNSPDQVTGRTTPRTTKIKWKPVDVTGIDSNDNDVLPKGPLKNGRLQLSGGQVLTLPPGTYYFPAGIRLSGNSRIEVTGPTRIIMGGNSSISGSGIVNQTQGAANLRIDITDGSVDFSGNSAFYADIYEPTARVKINGNAGFYGAVFAKRVELSGNASQIHGDEALRREYDETTRSKLMQ